MVRVHKSRQKTRVAQTISAGRSLQASRYCEWRIKTYAGRIQVAVIHRISEVEFRLIEYIEKMQNHFGKCFLFSLRVLRLFASVVEREECEVRRENSNNSIWNIVYQINKSIMNIHISLPLISAINDKQTIVRHARVTKRTKKRRWEYLHIFLLFLLIVILGHYQSLSFSHASYHAVSVKRKREWEADEPMRIDLKPRIKIVS